MTSVVNQPTRRSSPARSGAGRRRSVSPWVYVASVVVALGTLAPVVYAVLSGFRSNGQIGANPVALPNPWVFDNYVSVIMSSSFWQYALNSVIIAAVTTALVVVAGVMAAYPLARYRFKGRQALFNVFVMGLLFPLTVAIIPLFLMVRDLNLTNTYWGVALPQAAFALPMTIVILRPFLMALPNELEEASMLDGASRIGFFWRILVPLSGPGMVTTGVLAFVASWNGYLLPLLFINDPALKTLPLGVADFSTEHSANTAGVLAFTSLAVIPALVFFLTMQKRIVSGLQGAVKG